MKDVPNQRHWISLHADIEYSEKEAQHKLILDESISLKPSTINANHQHIRRNV